MTFINSYLLKPGWGLGKNGTPIEMGENIYWKIDIV